MEKFDPFFAVLGQALTFGGGGVAIAYVLFQYLGKKWIENKFSERMEQLRHEQAKELQRLRVEIDSLLSGAIKLQDKEFEALPEAWTLLDQAFGQVSGLVSPLQHYPDLDRLSRDKLEEFLSSSKLHETDKAEIRIAHKKTKAYQEMIFWYRLSEVRQSVSSLHSFVERNSIFMPPDLKSKFEHATDELWSAMTSKEVGHSAQDWKMQNEGWENVKKVVEPLRKEIQSIIYARLQNHGRQRDFT